MLHSVILHMHQICTQKSYHILIYTNSSEANVMSQAWWESVFQLKGHIDRQQPWHLSCWKKWTLTQQGVVHLFTQSVTHVEVSFSHNIKYITLTNLLVSLD